VILHCEEQIVHVGKLDGLVAWSLMLSQSMKLARGDLVALETGCCSVESAHVLNECTGGGRRYF
jgi:hypothetical protein